MRPLPAEEHLPGGTRGKKALRIPTMLKQVIFWCAVFVVAVISAVLIGEMGSRRQGPAAQTIPLVSTTASATGHLGASEQSTAQHAPNLDEAAEPSRHSDR